MHTKRADQEKTESIVAEARFGSQPLTAAPLAAETLTAVLCKRLKELCCNVLSSGTIQQATDTLPISCLPKNASPCAKICQVAPTQLLSSPSPHLLDWVEVGRFRWQHIQSES